MLRLSELYTSVQGEGTFTGQMTQFVRFAGCNMRCPGWPCDTQFAIEPSLYLHDSSSMTAEELFAMLPEYPKHLCLTGGEPFLQKDEDLERFCHAAFVNGYTLECFSNGSFPYNRWTFNYGMHFMMDWKLSGSGESDTKLGQRLENAHRLRQHDGIKFVVCDRADLQEAYSVWLSLTQVEHPVRARFWVGAAWDRIDNQSILDFVQEKRLPWSLNVQIHKYIWPPDERGV